MVTAKKCNTAKQKTTKAEIQKLSALYDRIYDIADRLLKKHNPCKIHRTKKKKILCCTEMNSTYKSERLCCACCNNYSGTRPTYWSENGCLVKALACKLFLCQSIKNKLLKRRFLILLQYARKRLNFTFYDKYCQENISVDITSRYYYSKKDYFTLMEKVNGNKRKV